MEKREKRSSLPEDMFQRMEKSMKDSNRVLMVVSPEDIDPALQDPEFIRLITEGKARMKK